MITRSAPLAAEARSPETSSARPSARTRSSTASSRSTATRVRASRRWRAARASDDPISPTPTITRRSKRGSLQGGPRRSGLGSPALQEVAEGRDHEAVRLFAADREAQAGGQAVGIDPAQDQAAGAQKGVGVPCGPAGLVREVDEEEVADAGRHG